MLTPSHCSRVARVSGAAFRPLLLLAAFVLSSWAASATTFHSSANDYTVDAPDDWVRVPDAELQRTLALVQKPGQSASFTFEAGLQPKANERWLAYPYVLVQVMPYRGLGLNRQISESEFPQVIRSMTGLDFDKMADKALSPEARSLMSDVKFGKPELDVANHRFFWANQMVVGGEKVRGSSAGYFGHDALVMVNFYASEADWDRLAGARGSIANSFRFGASGAFNPADDAQMRARRLGEMVGRAIVPLVVIAVVVLVVVKLVKRKPTPQPAAWVPPPPGMPIPPPGSQFSAPPRMPPPPGRGGPPPSLG